MKPHPHFKDRAIPRNHVLGDFRLCALSVDDVKRDFNAIMESAAEIKAAHPDSSWPDGLTEEKNLIDLAWHQREFEAKRSFAWVIENDDGDYLGCLYIYPSIGGERSADVRWWWRAGVRVDRDSFREDVSKWLASALWPPLDYEIQS